MTDSTKRQPAGIPVGGQFASHDRADAEAHLAERPENPILAARVAFDSPAEWWLHDIACIKEQALPEDGDYPATMIEILDAIGMWDESSQSALGYSDQQDAPDVWAERMAILDAAAAALDIEQAGATS